MPRKKTADTTTTPTLFAAEDLPVPHKGVVNVKGIAFPVGEPDSDMKIVVHADNQPNETVLAQHIFADMLGQHKSFEVDQSPQDFGYRKSTALLDTSELSLVARRIANAICYVVSQNPQHSKHDIDLGFVRWLIRFSSRNKSHFIQALKECGKVRLFIGNVEGYDPDAFVSVTIFPTIAFNGTNRIVVEVSDILRKELNGPRLYSFLSLRNLARLDSAYATVLYERLVHFVFRGQTDWMTPQDFRLWFRDEEGKPYAREWKYVKRDIIDIAVEQINANTNIEVHPVFRTQGRGGRVAELMFTVKEVHKINDDPRLRGEIYDTLRNDFGLTESDFNKLSERADEVTDADIMRAMEYTRHAVDSAPADKPIKRINKYFMWAIENKDKAFIPALERQQQEKKALVVQKSKEASDVVAERAKSSAKAGASKHAQIAADGQQAIEDFSICMLEEKEALLAKFKGSQMYRLNKRKIEAEGIDLNLESAVTNDVFKSVFATFLATAMSQRK